MPVDGVEDRVATATGGGLPRSNSSKSERSPAVTSNATTSRASGRTWQDGPVSRLTSMSVHVARAGDGRVRLNHETEPAQLDLVGEQRHLGLLQLLRGPRADPLRAVGASQNHAKEPLPWKA